VLASPGSQDRAEKFHPAVEELPHQHMVEHSQRLEEAEILKGPGQSCLHDPLSR